MRASMPFCNLDRKLFERGKRNVLTSAAASCYPFTSYEMSDENGVLLGVNKHNNSLVIVDIFIPGFTKMRIWQLSARPAQAKHSRCNYLR